MWKRFKESWKAFMDEWHSKKVKEMISEGCPGGGVSYNPKDYENVILTKTVNGERYVIKINSLKGDWKNISLGGEVVARFK